MIILCTTNDFADTGLLWRRNLNEDPARALTMFILAERNSNEDTAPQVITVRFVLLY